MKDWGAILRVLVIVWAIACVYCLSRAEQEYEPVEPPIEEPVTVEIIEEPIPEEPEENPLEQYPSIENATLTHYCICKACCGKDETHPAYGITASGRKAEPYLSVAVDPFVIPLGSTVYVDYGDEIKEYRADDTGSAITGAKLDLCVPDHAEALELGVKTVKVWWSE